MSSCVIHLNNNKTDYNAGDVIAGKVICVFNTLKSIAGIKLKLKGKEHNKWPGTETYYDENAMRKKTRPVYYNGQNIFLLVENILKGEGDLGPGRYEFPFSLQLPFNIPGSYYGRYGGVNFYLSVAVERPLKPDYTDSKQIKVFSPINLEDMKDQLQLEPISYSDEKMLGCWCCICGPISMDVHLEKEAFTIGEVAKIKVEINNASSENIDRMVVKMGTTVKSMVTHPSNESNSNFELLTSNSYSGVSAHGRKTYNIELEIPQSAMVPNFNLCTLFSQNSKLQVTAVLSLLHEDLEIAADVIVGHTPLSDSENAIFSNSQAALSISSQPPSYASANSPQNPLTHSHLYANNPLRADAEPSPPPPDISAPSKKDMTDAPPSYEEAMSTSCLSK